MQDTISRASKPFFTVDLDRTQGEIVLIAPIASDETLILVTLSKKII